MIYRYFAGMVLTALILSACDDGTAPSPARNRDSPSIPTSNTAAPIERKEVPQVSFSTLMRGGRLYGENCARCHGERGEGAPHWQQPGPDGKYPAPPLNGSGHTWHHPMTALKTTIRNGTETRGGNMPAWQGKLSDTDIDAIIAWLQAQWPGEIYRAWKRMDAAARAGGK